MQTMAYVKKFDLQLPGADTVIWRYMDFWKYQKLIDDKAFFLARADCFSDSWDSQLPPHWIADAEGSLGVDRSDGLRKYTKREWYVEREIPTNPICCFNMNKEESERMWKAYTTITASVVVKSTVGRLVQSLAHFEKEAFLGVVRYGEDDRIDRPHYSRASWEGEPVLLSNPWYVPRFLKKEEFQFEQELRLTAHFSQSTSPFDRGTNLAIGELGIVAFVEEVRMNPASPADFGEAVRELHVTHGFNRIPIIRSRLQ